MNGAQLVGGASIIAAAILTLAAGPASAAAPPNDHNCYGATESGFVAGPGGNPGSKHNPDPNFTDPVTGGPTWNGPYTSYYAQQPGTTKPNGVSDNAQSNRETYAACGGTAAP